MAVKKLIDQELSGKLLDEFRMETSIMKKLRHVNVLLFLGAVSIPGHLVRPQTPSCPSNVHSICQ